MPAHITVDRDYFACKVVGNSMNRVIPDGAICLFRKHRGGSRKGQIVLVECTGITDADIGSRYTVKEYDSYKTENEEGWRHERFVLKPKSFDPDYKAIELTEEQLADFCVIGEFVQVL